MGEKERGDKERGDKEMEQMNFGLRLTI